MKKPDLISVYIVTWNRLEKLKRALFSVQKQTLSTIEIIVVDNGSSDGTAEFLEAACERDDRIIYIPLDQNYGACVARNRAINAAKGHYVTGMDDDDEWLENRLESLVAAYHEESAFSFSDDVFIFSDGRRNVTRKPEKVDIEEMKYHNAVGNQVLTTKEKFIAAGLFDESLPSAQDYDMWFRLMEAFGAAEKSPVASQIVYASGDEQRISNSKRKLKGYLKFYNKHKRTMNASQRKTQILVIRYQCQLPISLSMFVRLFSFKLVKRRVRIFIEKVIFKKRVEF